MPRDDDEWLGAEDVSELFKVPLKTVYTWNHSRSGPSAYRIGRHVRYLRSEVDAWAKARKVSW